MRRKNSDLAANIVNAPNHLSNGAHSTMDTNLVG
jgi:hypothetical protein